MNDRKTLLLERDQGRGKECLRIGKNSANGEKGGGKKRRGKKEVHNLEERRRREKVSIGGGEEYVR